MQLKNNSFIQWWMTEKFPLIHLSDKTGTIKKWLVHPIKRRFAKLYLSLLQNFTDIKVIGITGSAGKTTTKEMLASVLKNEGKTVYSKENIDPIYNIPSTILRTSFGTKYLILEMGIEYPGEMNFYLWMAKPDIGVITNIFPTHLEFLNNKEGVLKEKGELVLSLSKNQIAILCSGDEMLMRLSKKINAKVVWFKKSDDPLMQNSLITKAIAESLGVGNENIERGLKNFEKPMHRLATIKHKSGAIILDDSYNSNPEALISALKYFNKYSGGKNMYAVLGDMKELGNYEEEAHRNVGRIISKMGFKGVIGVGDAVKYLIKEVEKDSKNTETHLVKHIEDALPLINPFLKKGNNILIKGSRSIALDKLVDTLV